MNTPNYETKENDLSGDGVKFLFTSEGKIDIANAVQYSYIMNLRDMKVYNLGFGVYEDKSDTIDDHIITENGDVYIVFNTVLRTVPKFFELFENAIILITGSDSSLAFTEKCKLTCKKKCTSSCKNHHRRIKTYQYYLDKNYDKLVNEYSFLGGSTDHNHQTILEKYEPQKNYDSLWILKNNM